MRTINKETTKGGSMEYIGTYGNYSYNTSESYKKAHASKWRDDLGIVYYKSYSTIISFKAPGHHQVVMQNYWSTTTGKHLNWIDGGDKKERYSSDEFDKALETVKKKLAGPDHKETKEPDMLKTVGMVSAMFGLLSENDKEAKVKYQKRFYEKVPGIQFPEDWDQLSTEEKEKRLNNVNSVALEKREG